MSTLTVLLMAAAMGSPQTPAPIAFPDVDSASELAFISSTSVPFENAPAASPAPDAAPRASKPDGPAPLVRLKRPLKRPLLRELRYDPDDWPSHALTSKTVLVALLLIAAVALRKRPAPWPAILGVATGLLALNLVLDLGDVSLSYNRRGILGGSFAAPLFAFVAPAFAAPVLGHVLWIACFLGVGLPWLLGSTCRSAVFGFIVYATAIAAPIGLGLSSPWSSIVRHLSSSRFHYSQHVQPLGETASILSGYVESMPSLSLHASTHGPGPLLGLAFLRTLVGDSTIATAIALQVLGALLPIVTWLAARSFLEERAARIAAVLVLLSPSFHQFSFISIDGVIAPLLFGAAALMMRCLFAETRSRTRSALLVGVIVYLCALWTFSTAFLAPLGVIAAGLAIRRGMIAPRVALQTGLLAASSFLAAHLVMLTLGFDLWACFLQARENNTELMGSAFRSFGHYLLSSTGNLGAFMIGCGIPVTAMWLSALRAYAKERSPGTCITIASSATILLLAVLGLYQWEVERIWLFAVPLVCISASRYLHDVAGSNPRRIVAVAGVLWLQTLAMELMLDTYW